MKPLKAGDRVYNPDGVLLTVRAVYKPASGRMTEVALRSADGAIDFLADLKKVEKWERA